MDLAVVASDAHIPYHNPRALRLVRKVTEVLKPRWFIWNGDLLDCASISRFNRSPLEPDTLDHELYKAKKLVLDPIGKHCKERILIGGNHEDRLRRWLEENRDVVSKLGKTATKLILKVLDIPQLLDLANFGFTYYPYSQPIEKSFRLGKLLVHHGLWVSQNAAKKHLESFGESVLIGHTHRLKAFYKSYLSGPHGAWESGCTCNLQPRWSSFTDWQSGFSVVQVDATTGFFNVQLLPILRNRFILYGNDKISI